MLNSIVPYPDPDTEELKEKRICSCCVHETYLADKIDEAGEVATCSYCGQEEPAITIGDLSERVNQAFKDHYERTSPDPDDFQMMMLRDKESDYEWDREGEPVVYAIMNAASIPEQAARDVQKILEEEHSDWDASMEGYETEFNSESYYDWKAPDAAEWQQKWTEFEQSLRTETRFFSAAASALLASIFAGLGDMKTRTGRSVVRTIGARKPVAIYRARVFHVGENLEPALVRPDIEIGPPPYAKAKAGRMNAAGISVFYGATNAETAIAEVRPPVGSRVITARFEIIRPVRLLDLSALIAAKSEGSIFDPEYADRKARAGFLRDLSVRIAEPVMPTDEVLGYLPTQAIADFLATEMSPPLDGMIFPSVQVAGHKKNVVLFHKASRVAALDFPEGTKISASTGNWSDDGWEHDYRVFETTPSAEEIEKREAERKKDDFPFDYFPTRTHDEGDVQPVTLRVDLETIAVHAVRAVAFTTEEFKVWRHRSEKRDPGF